ncbi:hypothetical protein KC929_01835 [Patescibacteria group bacterium]|nr:hypothetical protein [Patescibacteria group bacterium]
MRYFLYYPRNWRSIESFGILITEGIHLGCIAPQSNYMKEMFSDENIEFVHIELQINSSFELLERLKTLKITRGEDNGLFHKRIDVTPQKMVRLLEYDKIEKIIDRFTRRKLNSFFQIFTIKKPA